jgi:nucleotide-binding universal stress UspA family protein
MLMYRRILVPVDGSTTSMLGLRHALGLAKEQKARLRVLNVIDDMALVPMIDGYPGADMATLIDSLKAAGEKAIGQAKALAARQAVTVDAAIVESHTRPVSDVILDDAAKWRADLLVMGTHGRRGFNRLLLGSDAERVLREASVPVLLVRGEQPTRKRARRS